MLVLRLLAWGRQLPPELRMSAPILESRLRGRSTSRLRVGYSTRVGCESQLHDPVDHALDKHWRLMPSPYDLQKKGRPECRGSGWCPRSFALQLEKCAPGAIPELRALIQALKDRACQSALLTEMGLCVQADF